MKVSPSIWSLRPRPDTAAAGLGTCNVPQTPEVDTSARQHAASGFLAPPPAYQRTVVLRCDLDNLAAGEKQAPQPLQPGGATIGVAWCSRRLEDSAEITLMWLRTPHQRVLGESRG
jgi:hypothetical protein